MVASADNLNLDVLEHICCFCADSDFHSLTLVSRAFCLAALPCLYRNISFSMGHAKRYPRLLSPFAIITRNKDLAIHVRSLDLRAVPLFRGTLHPEFMLELASAMTLCQNLKKFRCVLPTNSALIAILPSLGKKERLHTLRINGAFTAEQAVNLKGLKQLRSLTLDFSSWQTLNTITLGGWANRLSNTLTSLTIYNSPVANEWSLRSSVEELPHLRGLHVIGCEQIDYLQTLDIAKDIPDLESLAVTTWRKDPDKPLTVPHPLPNLRHVSVDSRSGKTQENRVSLTQALTHFSAVLAPALSSVKIRAADPNFAVASAFVEKLLDEHAGRLTNLSIHNCSVKPESLTAICKRCVQLEQLEFRFDTDNLVSVYSAVTNSKSLKTLVNLESAHIKHGRNSSLTRSQASAIMDSSPSVTKIISQPRTFVRRTEGGRFIGVDLGPRTSRDQTEHWFMPRS